MEKVKVFIADKFPVFREGLKSVLANFPESQLVGEAEDGKTVVEEVSFLKPDVVIMDIKMPGLDGIQATRRISKETPGTKVIILSVYYDQYYIFDAFQAGAMAYVIKGSAPEELLLSIKKVTEGKRHVSSALTDMLLSDLVDVIRGERPVEPFDALSTREKEVLKLVAEGETSREIAKELFIAVSTVKSHRNNIMKKLKVNDIAGLIKIAIRKGIIKTD